MRRYYREDGFVVVGRKYHGKRVLRSSTNQLWNEIFLVLVFWMSRCVWWRQVSE